MKWVFCIVVVFLQAMSKGPPPTQAAQKNIGVRTLNYFDAKRKRPIVIELWYPTFQVGPLDTPEDPAWVHPQEIRDVAIAEGKHPLIVMSHGHGGDRRDRSWLSEYLVRNGYIVASVEHYGNSWRSYNPLLSLRFWERARDVSFSINHLLKDPSLRGWIDPKRIGFVGYSLGGMTGLALGGARAENVKEIVIRQQENLSDIDPELIKKVDFSEAQGNFSDRRIKAMVLLSPAAFIFPSKSLQQVKIPVALVASEGDEVLPFEEHAYKVITHLVPAKIKLLDRVSHYVFLNRVSDEGKELLRNEIHSEVIQSDRLMIHREVGVFVAEFFNEQLPRKHME